MSISLLPRELPPLAFVWTSSKLLVLDSLLVNSVKLNLLVAVLEVDRRLSAFGRIPPSSDTLLGVPVDISRLAMPGVSCGVLLVLWFGFGRLLACAVCGRIGGDCGIWVLVTGGRPDGEGGAGS